MTRNNKLTFLLLVVIGTSLCFYLTFSTFSNKDYYNYVDSRIERIMKKPKAMAYSSPSKYFEISKNEYNEIYKLTGKALPILEKIMSEEESRGVHGLRYVLALQIKQDIVNRTNYFDKTPN